MSEFKVGDRVRCINSLILGEVGTVIDVAVKIPLIDDGVPKVAVEFDNEVMCGHDYGGKCKTNKCLVLPTYQFEKLECEESEPDEPDEPTETVDSYEIASRLADLCTDYARYGREHDIPLEALLLGLTLAY